MFKVTARFRKVSNYISFTSTNRDYIFHTQCSNIIHRNMHNHQILQACLSKKFRCNKESSWKRFFVIFLMTLSFKLGEKLIWRRSKFYSPSWNRLRISAMASRKTEDSISWTGPQSGFSSFKTRKELLTVFWIGQTIVVAKT